MKDKIIEKISQFQLYKNIKTFQAEDIPVMDFRNLDQLTRQSFIFNLIYIRWIT